MVYEELQKTLERIGLSTNEAKVYLALLRLGSSKAGDVSKKSQVNRTTTYDTLERLLERGLVSFVVKDNRKWFEAVNPSMLTDFLGEREEEAKRIIPYLQRIYKSPGEKHDVTLYFGYKGVKSIFQDIIREGKPNCVMDSEGQFVDRLPYYAPHFIRQLEKKKIKVRHIVREGRNVSPSKTTEVRFVKKKTKSEAVFNIYGDKIAIIIWRDPPEAVMIHNKAVTDSVRDYFEMLWKAVGKRNH